MANKTEKAPKNTNKKKRDFAKPFRFFKEVFYELKKVTWPSRKELRNNTVTVIVVTLLAAVLIGLLDWGMGHLYKVLLGL